MRTRLAWALSVLGVLIALLGLVVMVVLGPDSRFSTGPHPVETDDIAIVTAPKVISWAGLQVDVLAEVPARKPVFVGIANTVDVQDYVGKTARLEVTGFRTPWEVRTREVKGRPSLPGAPTALDWWIAQSAGLGGASVSTKLPDETVSAVILSVGSTNLSGIEVTFAYGIRGGFYQGAALLLLGLAAAWSGWVLRRDGRLWRDEDDDESEEVVYVYVDEDGVEHEISADEAREYDIVEETVEVIEDEPQPAIIPARVEVPPAERPVVEVEPAAEPVKVAGVLTAAEIAADDEPEPEPVVYVYVDEDGVEHEVGEHELADFEVVDEEEERP
jgi:hypothetical protein